MTVDDAADLVGALRRLIYALREAGDDTRRRAEQMKEARDVRLGQSRRFRGRDEIGRNFTCAYQRLSEAGCVGVNI